MPSEKLSAFNGACLLSSDHVPWAHLSYRMEERNYSGIDAAKKLYSASLKCKEGMNVNLRYFFFSVFLAGGGQYFNRYRLTVAVSSSLSV